MITYAKLASTILTSTIWQESAHTKLLWITILALKDADGCVHASLPGLAYIAKIPLEDAVKAMEIFLAPDKFSRSKEFDGRRLEVIDGGWRVLNHSKYRDLGCRELKNSQARDRMAKYRERQKAKEAASPQSCYADVTPCDAIQRQDTSTPPLGPKTEKPFPEAEIPSWDEWWAFCQSLQCGLPAEWYARDKWLGAEQKRWAGIEDWRSYALRCRGWWEEKGKPMTPPEPQKRNGGPNAAQRGPYLSELKTVLEAKKALREKIKRRGHEDAFGFTPRKEDAEDYKALNKEIGEMMERIANYDKETT